MKAGRIYEMCLAAGGMILAALAVAGCTSSRETERGRGFAGKGFAPQAPAFLKGPMSALLTNVDGFTARVMMETKGFSEKPEVVSGQLFGSGSRLLFTPESGMAGSKPTRSAGLSFIWDVSQASGFLLSEALQGYAPISSQTRPMNVIVKNVLNSVPMSVDGHRCEEQEADVASSYGSTAAFSVWRAADLQGFAMRIASVTNSATLTVSFSKVRIEQPPEDIFLPPNGFTKYDSAEAMMDELASRQLNLRRSGPSPFSGMEHGEGAVGSQGGRRY